EVDLPAVRRRAEPDPGRADRVAHRPVARPARGRVRGDLAERRLHLAVLPGGPDPHPRLDLRGRPDRRRRPRPAAVAHDHPAAAAHHVLPRRHPGGRELPGVRHGLRPHRRRPPAPHRGDRLAHLHRGLRLQPPGPRERGRGDPVPAAGGDHAGPAALVLPPHHLRHELRGGDKMTASHDPSADEPTAPTHGRATPAHGHDTPADGRTARPGTPRAPVDGRSPSRRPRRLTGSLLVRRLFGYSATYLVLAVAAVLTLGPFLFSVMTAFTSTRQFAQEGPLSVPAPPVVENFLGLFTPSAGSDGFVTPVVVTVQMVAVILAGQMVFSVLAAYAFAQLRFPGRDLLFWVYVATLMVPQVVVVVPLYLMLSEVGLRNTFWALVLPFVLGSPYAIFLLRENFRGVPSELMDAMRIDGAGTLRLLWHLVVPLNRPIIVTLVLITVVTHWNNFMWPMVIT